MSVSACVSLCVCVCLFVCLSVCVRACVCARMCVPHACASRREAALGPRASKMPARMPLAHTHAHIHTHTHTRTRTPTSTCARACAHAHAQRQAPDSDGSAGTSHVEQACAKPPTKWTHWDLSPGPSACGADVIPLHHVPIAFLLRLAGLHIECVYVCATACARTQAFTGARTYI